MFVIITKFVTKLAALTEEDSSHICREFRYNILFYLKLHLLNLKSESFEVNK